MAPDPLASQGDARGDAQHTHRNTHAQKRVQTDARARRVRAGEKLDGVAPWFRQASVPNTGKEVVKKTRKLLSRTDLKSVRDFNFHRFH